MGSYRACVAHLTIRIKGEDGHRRQQLDQDRMVLGRTSECDIPIKYDGVSREHCALTREDDRWFIEDLGSSNGTRVNGERIDGKVELQERDVIKLSRARLTVHVRERPQSVLPGTPDLPVREAGPDDPQQAAPCPHCRTWLSIAHRLPGDLLTCPRCHSNSPVPTLITSENE
jgi:hypothetical protein